MNQSMDPTAFYEKQPEPIQSCFLALRQILLQKSERINETIKYGMPCFCWGKRILCYLWKDKSTNEPYILFAEGRQMQHPALEQGTRARMKILRVDPNIDIPIELVHTVCDEAIQLFESDHPDH